jgi:quercetin dioxygenase-like cupin family protein
MPPGNKIPTHKHLHEDEVIFVHKGAVRVTLAGREYDAGTGATVFIPHGNWIGVANVSSEPAMILFFFNKPAFDASEPCPHDQAKHSSCQRQRKWRLSERNVMK